MTNQIYVYHILYRNYNIISSESQEKMLIFDKSSDIAKDNSSSMVAIIFLAFFGLVEKKKRGQWDA